MNAPLLNIRKVEHVSWTVAKLEPVIDFYVEIFGARILYQIGPLDSTHMPRDAAGRDWTSAHLGIAMARFSLAMLEFPGGFKVELFHYAPQPGANQEPLSSGQVGSHHLGLEVDNLEIATAFLAARGCTMLDCIAMDSGPTVGSRFCYFQDPWKNIFELVEHPR
ncbi:MULTISPECIES: VOC family protein [unclassified Serratia (in: enterobacteria)]|uniref:VOC family protein n=1 Tax=unclassified Serratia (in: enterobacteria) TaxID=2647522 RepID=UPI0005055EDC|nr:MULTISPECIES: VOC family protein [unclassified Serratia (in: enterobacteria)]KFK95697.1 glyoxalase [Serratia sp. Ag2]KFK95959.1 glyoxalase [Serratia sp. Ag1]